MATPPILAERMRTHGPDNHGWRAAGRLGLLNGLLIGLALAAGLWLLPVISLLRVPVTPITLGGLAVGTLGVMAVAAAAGWTSARLERGWATLLIWIVAAVVVAFLIAFQSYQLPTRLLWLVEPALSGQEIYLAPEWSAFGIIVTGFFIILVFALLALLQEYRLDGIRGELRQDGRLTGSAWLLLLLPLPFVFGAGILTGNFYGSHLAPTALGVVQEGISTASSYEGDLFELERETGFDYAALQGVQEQLGGEYRLSLAATDPESGTTTVAAHFENGAWINCRLIHDQLNYCYDASPPYTLGFSALITGEEAPEDCSNCELVVSDEWQQWLAERRDALGSQPRIEFVRQRGSFVLMRATATGGDMAIECWFSGISPIWLDSCQELER